MTLKGNLWLQCLNEFEIGLLLDCIERKSRSAIPFGSKRPFWIHLLHNLHLNLTLSRTFSGPTKTSLSSFTRESTGPDDGVILLSEVAPIDPKCVRLKKKKGVVGPPAVIHGGQEPPTCQEEVLIDMKCNQPQTKNTDPR